MSPPTPPKKRFTTRVRVRYADTGASGTAHARAYLMYFEVARVEALRSLGVTVGGLEESGIFMPVVEARVTCLRPALLDDLLEVTVLLDRFGPASFAFDYEVARDGQSLATGWTRMAVIDHSGGAVRLPDWAREMFRGIAGER